MWKQARKTRILPTGNKGKSAVHDASQKRGVDYTAAPGKGEQRKNLTPRIPHPRKAPDHSCSGWTRKGQISVYSFLLWQQIGVF
jgi:hypothetical protein